MGDQRKTPRTLPKTEVVLFEGFYLRSKIDFLRLTNKIGFKTKQNMGLKLG